MLDRPLRIHIITEEDPFYLPVFFSAFLAALPRERIELTGIDITPPLNQSGLIPLARRLHEFYGTVDFFRLGLRYAWAKGCNLLLPQSAWSGSVKRMSAAHGVPCHDVDNVNAQPYVERLRALDLDLLISVAASQIFKGDLLSVPRLAAINIHTGRLPSYRGMLPVFWQMYESEPALCATIHTMTLEIDRGDLLLEKDVPLDGERCLDAAIRKGKSEGARAMLELLDAYCREEVQSRPMPDSGGAYRSFPKRPDARRFRSMGNRLL